jgi:hypothetical protein
MLAPVLDTISGTKPVCVLVTKLPTLRYQCCGNPSLNTKMDDSYHYIQYFHFTLQAHMLART